MKPENKTQDQTRERILDEAERLFAREGFAAVSVRQITNAAEVNLASVNYHFGNKHNLYLEVFRSRWLPRAARVREKLTEMVEAGRSSPAEVIRAMAASFFSGIDDSEVERHRQLMTRELADPSDAFDLVAEQAMKPMFELMGKCLDGTLPPDTDREKKLLTIWSLFSQILFFQMVRLPIIKITGRKYDDQFKQELVEHVTDFSLRGLGLNPEAAK